MMHETDRSLTEIKILAMCAAYNRREVTLAGLRSVHSQQLPASVKVQLAVVDDNSQDGTIDAIHQEFPAAFVLKGTGSLYWAGAMRLGFSTLWNPEQYTHLLVFNDDCQLYPDALETLVATYEYHAGTIPINSNRGLVVVGSFHDGLKNVPTYGGHVRHEGLKPVMLSIVKPASKAQNVDTLNMNFALIDRRCLEDHRLIEDHFTHGYADLDFGLRVHRHGVPVIVAPNYQGICYRNSIENTWQDSSLTLGNRIRHLLSPKGLPFVPRYHFLRRHAPNTWPVFLFWPYIKLPVSHLCSRAFSVLLNRHRQTR